MNQKTTMVVLDVPFNRACAERHIGKVFDHNFPSYVAIAGWETLSNTTFNLLGVTIKHGHKDIDLDIVLNVVKVINSVTNHPVEIACDLSSGCGRFLVRVVETDAFTVDAFCFGVSFAGWDASPVVFLDDAEIDEMPASFVNNECSVFKITIPDNYTPKIELGSVV